MAEIQSLNHSAICVHDLHAAEEFYCGILGAKTVSATDFNTYDVEKGRSLHKSVVLSDYLIALMLARDFMPMPPATKHRGAHGFRHAFTVPKMKFDALIRILGEKHVPYEGPIEHPENGPFGASIYVTDPSGNFLELIWRRDESVDYDPVKGVGEA